jgi:GTP-binding protein
LLSQHFINNQHSPAILFTSVEPEETTYFSPNVPLGNRHIREETSNITSSSSEDEYSFFDQITMTVQAGSGGQGASTYKRTKGGQQGPPDGGNGGRGGHVVVMADSSMNTLASLQRRFVRAEKGQDGTYSFQSGKSGTNAIIRVPLGTVVHQVLEHGEQQWLGRLIVPQEELVVAQGGVGGEGSGVTANTRGVIRPRNQPTKGERKVLELTLELIADVALVGVPNAGKSTLLAAVTRAQPKIANYPFTTVVPNLGVWNPSSPGRGLILCDVPGLIEGAARGVGLGHAFLRHVDRCHVILHLVDATSNDPIADYEMLNREMIAYGTGQLARMPQVVVVNKMDAYEEGSGEEWEEGLRVKFTKEELEHKLKEVMPHSRLLWMSAKEKEGVDDLMGRLAAFVQKVKESTSDTK